MNKRQRKKRDKKELKDWNCDKCGDTIKVLNDYEPIECCSGYLCGCYGYPINPVLCEKCMSEIYK